VASKTADEIELQMKSNLAAFQAGQIDRQTALSNFALLWNALQSSCTQIGGDAGRNCIDDRKAGACKWHDSAGECWNWDTGYRAPIAAAVEAPTVSVVSQLANLSPAYWLLGGLAVWGLVEAVN
jgi:hypothetical protein